MSRLPVVFLHLAGAVSFLWPFLWPTVSSGPQTARSSDAPWIMALSGLLLAAVLVSEMTRARMTSRTIALLGVLIALAAMLRLPGSFAGAGLFFLVPLCAGFAFGPTFGFLTGSLGMVASALLTGGVGPWVPFQMFAAGWIGGGAGLMGIVARRLQDRRGEVAMLAVTGAVAALLYGLVINLYFWPVIAQGDAGVSWHPGLSTGAAVTNYLRFYVLTSVWWDAIGAVSNAVLLSLVGGPTLFLLRRSRQRLTFDVRPQSSYDQLSVKS